MGQADEQSRTVMRPITTGAILRKHLCCVVGLGQWRLSVVDGERLSGGSQYKHLCCIIQWWGWYGGWDWWVSQSVQVYILTAAAVCSQCPLCQSVCCKFCQIHTIVFSTD